MSKERHFPRYPFFQLQGSSKVESHGANVPGLFLIGRHLTPPRKGMKVGVEGGEGDWRRRINSVHTGDLKAAACDGWLIENVSTSRYSRTHRCLGPTWIRHNRIIVEIETKKRNLFRKGFRKFLEIIIQVSSSFEYRRLCHTVVKKSAR